MSYRILWGIVVIAGIFYIALQFQPDRLQTNLFDLLPKQTEQDLPNDVLDAYSERLSRKVGILIASNNHNDAARLAEQLQVILTDSNIFKVIHTKMTQDQLTMIYQTYHPHRFGLLSSDARKHIQLDNDWLFTRLLKALVSPVSGLSSTSLLDDPFLLFQDYLAALPKGNPRISMVDGYAEIMHNDKYYIIITAELNASPFEQVLQDNFSLLQAKIDSSIKLSNHQSIEIFGVIRHAVENRRLAQTEITIIGTGSLIGIILVFVLVFQRSIRLLLILLPVMVGMLLALAVSLLVFGDLHLISLVFGISLIGVSIDYALHYSCANSSLTNHATGMDAMTSVRPALTLGLITSIVGYLTLATANFPALRQMAVIAVAGLVGAYFTVLIWLPVLLNKSLTIRDSAESRIQRYTAYIAQIGKIPVWGIAGILIVLFGVIIVTKHSNDDIKMMRAHLPQLDQIDEQFKQVLAEYPNSQYILVKGSSAESVLQREQAILSEIRQNKTVAGRVEGISDWIPTQAAQLQNRQLLRAALTNSEKIQQQMQQAGLPQEILAQYSQGVMDNSIDLLTIERFLASPLGALKSDAWLGEVNGKYYSIISLHGVDNLLTLSQLVATKADIYLVDRVKSVSKLLAFYRDAIESMFPYVMLAIFLILTFRYGVAGSFRVLAAPVCAALSSFILVQLIIGHYNLFTIFGLIITIAISIDYAVFIRESRRNRASTYLAISLAGLTTILAFGLLSLSETPALRTFGLTLLFGILFSYVITPLIVVPEKQPT